MRIDYKLSKYNFQSDVKKFQKYYKKNIDSATAQKLGTHLWRAYEKLFYVQIIFKGTPPLKIDKNTGEIKRKIGKGDVGIDIGTSIIAYCSENKLKILELADKIRDISAKKCRILRKMDRSKRMTNLNNFKIDGTIKKGAKFNFSNKYLKLKNTLKEIFRKEADIRKYQHECLANEIIALGDKIYVEDMNFKGLQKKSKKTEKNEKGSFKKKKRFGKSIGNRAPALLISIIDRKLKSFGTEIIKINTRKAKASQFNHLTQEYKKKSLSKRWNNIDGYKG